MWEDMGRDVRVFLEEDGQRKEVDVEKRRANRMEIFWFKEKNQQPPQEGEGAGDGSVTEEDVTMQEDTPEEVQAKKETTLVETITSLQKENEAMKAKIHEMEVRMAQQEEAARVAAGRHAAIESAIAEIVGHVRGQITFSESVRASLAGLVDEVQRHQDCFQEVAKILNSHEQHIVTSSAASQEMAQYINALAQENEKKTMWIAGLMRESNAQSQVIREQHVKQHVLAEMMKRIFGLVQEHTQQGVAATQVTVADVDEETVPGFPSGPSPHETPPNTQPFGVVNVVPQIPKNMEIVELH